MQPLCVQRVRHSLQLRHRILWQLPLHLDEPLGITAVAGIIQHNTSGIMSRAGDGIDTPAGLTGKTYSTWDSPIELAMLENVVNGDGGDFSQVTLIPNDITDEPAALAATSDRCDLGIPGVERNQC